MIFIYYLYIYNTSFILILYKVLNQFSLTVGNMYCVIHLWFKFCIKSPTSFFSRTLFGMCDPGY